MAANYDFFERHDVAAGIIPVNLATGANNGDWADITKFRAIAVVVFIAGGTAGQDPTITLKQARSSTGTGSKDLNFERIWEKNGSALSSVSDFTLVEQDADEDYTDDDLAENQNIIGIHVNQNMVDNGFTHIRVEIPDVGTGAQIGCALYIGVDPIRSYPDAPSLV